MQNVKLNRPGLSPPLNNEEQSQDYKDLKNTIAGKKAFFNTEEKKRHPHVFNCNEKSASFVTTIGRLPSDIAGRGKVWRTCLFGAFNYVVCFNEKPDNWTEEQWALSHCVGRPPGTDQSLDDL